MTNEREKANTIEEYFIERRVRPNIKEIPVPRYDLMRAVIVNISKDHDTEDSDSEMINILTALFNENMEPERKIELMDKYGIETTKEFESEVSGMTAYAAGLLAKGEARGEARGEEKGRKLLTYEYVSEGDVSPEKAAKRLGITVEELRRNMQLEGYSYPEK